MTLVQRNKVAIDGFLLEFKEVSFDIVKMVTTIELVRSIPNVYSRRTSNPTYGLTSQLISIGVHPDMDSIKGKTEEDRNRFLEENWIHVYRAAFIKEAYPEFFTINSKYLGHGEPIYNNIDELISQYDNLDNVKVGHPDSPYSTDNPIYYTSKVK